eukprot:8700008-Pyramimonas_sp.AAC.1
MRAKDARALEGRGRYGNPCRQPALTILEDRVGNYGNPYWQLSIPVLAITETRVGSYGNPCWQLWKPVLEVMKTRVSNYGNPCSVMETRVELWKPLLPIIQSNISSKNFSCTIYKNDGRPVQFEKYLNIACFRNH